MNNDEDVEIEDAKTKPDTKYIERSVGSPSVSGSGQHDEEDEEGREARDAQTNTTSTEPMVLTCSVCKHQLNSAWSLMQHMQVMWDCWVKVVTTFLIKSSSTVCSSPMTLSWELLTPSWWCIRRRTCWRCSTSGPVQTRCREWWYRRTFITSPGLHFAVFLETSEEGAILLLSGSIRGLTSLPSPRPSLPCLPITTLLAPGSVYSGVNTTYQWGESQSASLSPGISVTGRVPVTQVSSVVRLWCRDRDLGPQLPGLDSTAHPGHLPPPIWASIRD